MLIASASDLVMRIMWASSFYEYSK